MLAPIMGIQMVGNPNGGVQKNQNTTTYWPKPYSFNRKYEVIINRVPITVTQNYPMVILSTEKNQYCAKLVDKV